MRVPSPPMNSYLRHVNLSFRVLCTRWITPATQTNDLIHCFCLLSSVIIRRKRYQEQYANNVGRVPVNRAVSVYLLSYVGSGIRAVCQECILSPLNKGCFRLFVIIRRKRYQEQYANNIDRVPVNRAFSVYLLSYVGSGIRSSMLIT